MCHSDCYYSNNHCGIKCTEDKRPKKFEKHWSIAWTELKNMSELSTMLTHNNSLLFIRWLYCLSQQLRQIQQWLSLPSFFTTSPTNCETWFHCKRLDLKHGGHGSPSTPLLIVHSTFKALVQIFFFNLSDASKKKINKTFSLIRFTDSINFIFEHCQPQLVSDSIMGTNPPLTHLTHKTNPFSQEDTRWFGIWRPRS